MAILIRRGVGPPWLGAVAAGLDPEARGETYPVEEIIRLSNGLAKDEHERKRGERA